MDRDWEWEDLLADKPKSEKPPVKKKKSVKAKPEEKPKKAVKVKPEEKPEKDGTAKPEEKPKKDKTVKPEKDKEAKTEEKPKADEAAKTEEKPKTDKAAKTEEKPEKDDEAKTGEKPETDKEAKPVEKPKKKSAGGKKKRRKKKRKKQKKSRAFLICYLIFVLLLAAAGAVIVRNVYTTMEEMRDNAPEPFIRHMLKQLSDDDMLRLFDTNPAYETPAESALNIRNVLDSEELVLKRIEHNVYEAYLGDRKLFEARLNASASVNKLGLINYDILESCAITPIQGNVLYRYEIKAPSTCEITVNGKPVGEPESKETVKGFADADKFVELPSVNTYVVDALTKEPDIRALDNGMDVQVTLADKIDLTTSGETGHRFDSTQEAGIDFDAQEFARQWTMFNRNDLTGDLHGYYKIEEFLVPDSQMCKLAYQYANSQDIVWTSNHVLLDPPFTDEAVSNVVKYDDNTASVDVALKMHMLLDRGAERTDSIHTTVYLINLDGEWKVINTRDVEDGGGDDEDDDA